MDSTILHRLQADVYGTLKNTPALATANVLADDFGDIENKVAMALKTLTGNKKGLAIVVMQAEVTAAEKNLPGPVISAQIEIQVIEQVIFNRDTNNGTGIKSADAALLVLGTLHQRILGDVLLYADRDPVRPLPVKAGHVSHVVTLQCRLDGLSLTKKCGDVAASLAEYTIQAQRNIGSEYSFAKFISVPAGRLGNAVNTEVIIDADADAVSASVDEQSITITAPPETSLADAFATLRAISAVSSLVTMESIWEDAVPRMIVTPLSGPAVRLTHVGEVNGYGCWSNNNEVYTYDGGGSPTCPDGIYLVVFGGMWNYVVIDSGNAEMSSTMDVTPLPSSANWYGNIISCVRTGILEAAEFAYASGGVDAGSMVLANNDSDTDEIFIWYTTDGSFPAPGIGTLYDTPILIAAGTTVRAAVYAADLNPGDVLEFQIPA